MVLGKETVPFFVVFDTLPEVFDMAIQEAVIFNSQGEQKCLANLIGEFHNQAEIKEIKDLLLALGIKAEYLPGDNIKSGVLQKVHLNLYHSPISELFTKERLQVRFGHPYLTVSFFGPSETAGSLRDIGSALGLPSLQVEQVIRQGLHCVTEGINHYGSELFGKRVLVLLEDHKKDLISRILDDLGMKIIPIHQIKNRYLNPDTLRMFIHESRVQLVIGADQYWRRNGMGFPYLELPDSRRSFLGFNGFNNLAKSMVLALHGESPSFHE